MAYKLKTTHRFEKDLKRCIKRGLPMDKFREVVSLLVRDGALPSEYKPHELKGNGWVNGSVTYSPIGY